MQSTGAGGGDRTSQPSWPPDWWHPPAAASTNNNATTETSEYLHPQASPLGSENFWLSNISHGPSSAGSKIEAVEQAEAAEQIPSELPDDELVIERNLDRAVNRRLGGIHIFMITISGVLGIGLYVRGGMILRLAGPLAVLLSFALVGLLTWGVMQCIAEMLCIWPISGALSVYVTEFVDAELGIAVGVAYWFTYSISFAALIAATAGIAEHWGTLPVLQGVVLFFLIPSVLVVINSFGIQLYGLVEVIGGTAKLTFLAIIMIVMIVINRTRDIGTSTYPDTVLVHDKGVADSWGQAFFMSISIAAFAFVGVEITAASALEARVPKEKNPTASKAIGKTVKFSAVYISPLTALFYVAAGLLFTLNIKWNDPLLPRMSWAQGPPLASIGSGLSAVVLIARESGIDGLAGTLNVFLMITALTGAHTNLYVASRTLFSLTRTLDGGPGQPWYIQTLAYFGKTNSHRVPLRALIASCCFTWVPFLYLAKRNGSGTSIGALLEVLSKMGSTGVIIVWACECWAYIRFHACIERNHEALQNVPLVRRWYRGRSNAPDDYPYRSHGQPFTAYASLMGCLFILVVANGAGLWSGWHEVPFLSAYLAPLCFIAMWALLKVLRKGQWRLVDLSDGEELAKKMRKLHEIRWRSSENSDGGKRGMQNLWGLL